MSRRLPGRAVIAHNPVDPGDDPATSDVLAQAGLVAEGLAALGVAAEAVAVPGGRAWEVLPATPGLLVFNLIESPPGAPHLSPAAAAALEAMGVAFTGAAAASIWLTTDKIATRALLAASGLPVAPGGRLDLDRPEVLDRVAPPWIVKPACEDASVGIEGNPVCGDRAAALARGAELARRFPGQAVLVERYLPGRELNISLLEEEDGPRVLPVAEMQFLGFPPELPRVMGYEAKWHEGSFAYENTVRRYLDAPEDGPLLARVAAMALAAWEACGLAGYGRIDVRLDEAGNPFILEANANPCIAPEAGMVAAAGQAGLGARDLVQRIAQAALRRAEVRVDSRSGASPIAFSSPSPSRSSEAAPTVTIRDGLELPDREAIERVLRATGFFNDEEVGVALELVEARLAEGPGCHYRFLVGEAEGRVAGYACWGPIPGTRAAADLYWIAVAPELQKRGVGAELLAAAEVRMLAAGRRRIYVETSTRAQYEPTRSFYRGNGYRLAAELPEYYAPGDGKAIFVKVL